MSWFMPGTPCLNVQINIYPLFNGGFYLTVCKDPLNMMIRLAIGLADFRLWWLPRSTYAGTKPESPIEAICAKPENPQRAATPVPHETKDTQV